MSRELLDKADQASGGPEGAPTSSLVDGDGFLVALNDYSLELTSISATDDLFSVVAARLRDISGAIASAVSTFDETDRCLVVRHTTLTDDQSSAVKRFLGRRLEGMRFSLSEADQARISREVVGDAGSVSDSTFGGITAALGTAIERALGIHWLTGIGLTYRGTLVGTVVLAGGAHSRRPTERALRAFAGVTANALRRWIVERDYLASEARHRARIEGLPDMVFELTAELRIDYASPAVRKVLGVDPEAVLGRGLAELLGAEGSDEARAQLAAYLASLGKTKAGRSAPEPLVVTWPLPAAQGEPVWCELVVTPSLDAAAKLRGFVATGRDVSQRRRAESALAASLAEKGRLEQQLQQAARLESVGRLAGGIAHEFNNLLTTILTTASLSLTELRQGDPQHAAFVAIIEAAQNAAQITGQLHAFSAKEVAEPQRVDASRLVEGLLGMLRRLIGEDIDVIADLRPAPPIEVDPGQLGQVIVSLAINARDAMPSGGRLTITCAPADLPRGLGPLRPGRYLRIAVSDDGTGMTPEVRDHLFEPFFTTKPIGRGTGLGLTAIYGLVQGWAGHIEVETEVGRGTTMHVYLPVSAEGAAPKAVSFGDRALPRGNEVIVLVEDEAVVRRVTERLLKHLGYEVLSAASGEEALTLVAARPAPPDLLLTDVLMPHMNGRELAERMQREYPSLRVLFTSGYTDDIMGQRQPGEPGFNFLGKPYSPQSLALKLREIFGTGPARMDS